MAISEIYTGTGSTTLVSTTTQTPLCSFTAPTTKRGWLVGVRVGVGATNEAARTACLFQLYKLTNASSVANTTTNAVTPNDPIRARLPLHLPAFSASGTQTTAPTGVVNAIWQQEVPKPRRARPGKSSRLRATSTARGQAAPLLPTTPYGPPCRSAPQPRSSTTRLVWSE